MFPAIRIRVNYVHRQNITVQNISATKHAGTKHTGTKGIGYKTYQLQNVLVTESIGRHKLNWLHNLSANKCIGGQNVSPKKIFVMPFV
jgi:hypothetical protein